MEFSTKGVREGIEKYIYHDCVVVTPADLMSLQSFYTTVNGSLKENDFLHMGNVETLGLSSSPLPLQELPNDFFASFPKLTSLTLSDIQGVKPFSFVDSPPLRYVTVQVAGNNPSFPAHAFSGLNVQEIYLEHEKIDKEAPGSLRAGAFNGATIQELYLDPNLLPTLVDDNFFAGVRGLKSLALPPYFALKFVKLPKFKSGSLKSLTTLETLEARVDFANSDSNFLAPLTNLRSFHLQGVGFTKMEAKSLDPNKMLKRFEITVEDKIIPANLESELVAKGWRCHIRDWHDESRNEHRTLICGR